MVKTISTDFETEQIIEKMRERDRDFNLSLFVRNALLDYSGDTLNESVIINNLHDSKIRLEQAKLDVAFWEEKKRKLEIEKELDKRRQEELKKMEEEKRIKQEETKKNLFKIFKEELGRDMTEFEYDEYRKTGGNIWAFCDRIKNGK